MNDHSVGEWLGEPLHIMATLTMKDAKIIETQDEQNRNCEKCCCKAGSRAVLSGALLFFTILLISPVLLSAWP